MYFPELSPSGPLLPLVIWALVVAMCGLLMVVESVVIVARRYVTWHRHLLAVVPLVAAAGMFVLASQMWTAARTIACAYPHPRPLLPEGCFDPARVAQALNQFLPFGVAAVVVDAALLIAGFVGLRKGRKARVTG